jgi:uracil-DNA glycosylase
MIHCAKVTSFADKYKENMLEQQIEASWRKELETYILDPSFNKLEEFLLEQLQQQKNIYPASHQIFEAFTKTPFQQVKAIIIGQDPYHGPNQANGLAFSVNNNMPMPPSLKNIFKAIANDLPGYQIPHNGNLLKWANEGVLLLNTTLTVEEGMAGSHQKKGWEAFTDGAIKELSLKRNKLVFLLWGNEAVEKSKFINTNKHLILQAPHPSPLAAYRGFFDCHHFSKTNNFLVQNQIEPIDWQLI